MDSGFQDRGIAYPLRLSVRGGIAESAGAVKIDEAIRVLLGTRPGERLMRPTYGCQLHTLLFAPLAPTTANLAQHYVSEALRLWEPRIDVQEVRVSLDYDTAVLRVDLRYEVRATSEAQRLLFSFSLEQP